MGIKDSSHSVIREKISLKSSVIDVGNGVISGVNAQGNMLAGPMLMV